MRNEMRRQGPLKVPIPPERPPSATTHHQLCLRPSGKAEDEAHTPARQKYLQKEHREGCITPPSLLKPPQRSHFGREAEEGPTSAVRPIPRGRSDSLPSNPAARPQPSKRSCVVPFPTQGWQKSRVWCYGRTTLATAHLLWAAWPAGEVAARRFGGRGLLHKGGDHLRPRCGRQKNDFILSLKPCCSPGLSSDPPSPAVLLQICIEVWDGENSRCFFVLFCLRGWGGGRVSSPVFKKIQSFCALFT